jgi:hypothetical protein
MSGVIHGASPEAPVVDRLQAKQPWLFLIYALPAVVFLSVTAAPFQVTNELSHILRADQIGRSSLISNCLGSTVDGGHVAFGDLSRRSVKPLAE